MREPSTVVVEDDVPTEVALAASESPTILVEEPSPTRKSGHESHPRFGVRGARTKAVLAVGIWLAGLLVGFVGGWLFHEHSTSKELRQALTAVRQLEATTRAASSAHQDVDRASSRSHTPQEPAPRATIREGGISIAHAVDLLVQNRHREALAAYRVLSDLHPERRTFRDVVSVLEVKLRCQRGNGEIGACD